ncbi:carbohydrate ABC transporter permease [Alicyclobacillus fastidiosus]|uniref:Carbohydrate ABC transporter permease n=1 Tax=Alicyclobacillus fastidiosus TaxID=392011 RepID=A0ABY6ZFW5_9BACL|nr:carbohydrate ABC transporter permease [Alicyclobacillus fastidiosus]WAH41106.1 carbohydrate ABC transporter permease [Alicyclobacillus fastidiosus]GMA62661.1 sugar ABC transporter permease [Alicyclobacillus fastidiosus]
MSVSGSSFSTTSLQRKHHAQGLKNSAKTLLTMTLVIVMAAYFLLPLYWLLVSMTKNTTQLFSTPMLAFPRHLNLVPNLDWLSSYQGGIFWRWVLNSVIYAVITCCGATLVSAMAGYVIAMYNFRFKRQMSFAVLGALMVPSAAMVIPVFLMIKSLGLINTYAGVILPMLFNPFGVYFMMVYIQQAMPMELIDSGRIDGANDYGIFFRIGMPLIRPGLVTLLLITFVSTWNNFFLPLVLLNNSNLYPLTLGLDIWTANLNTAGAGQPLYPLILIGAFLSILPMLILFPLLRNYIVSGIAMGSVKS